MTQKFYTKDGWPYAEATICEAKEVKETQIIETEKEKLPVNDEEKIETNKTTIETVLTTVKSLVLLKNKSITFRLQVTEKFDKENRRVDHTIEMVDGGSIELKKIIDNYSTDKLSDLISILSTLRNFILSKNIKAS
jgi:hypothetical protein